jgi:alginate O-acetyltransferase complex protein AlgI
LWHGAKYTFVVWGLYQGLFLVFERLIGKKTVYYWMPVWAQVIVTNILVLFGWVVFRAPDLHQGLVYWGSMIGIVKPVASAALLSSQIFTPRHIFEMTLCAFLVWQPIQAHDWAKKLSIPKMAVCAALFLLAICGMFTQTFNPFLYVQF